MATHRLALVAFLTDDYDRTIDWFRICLGFHLLEDSEQGGGKRWVRMAASPDAETNFVIARAVGDQAAAIGNQFGGRVGFFLSTDNFEKTQARMQDAGVIFEEPPRKEPYGTVAVFRDLHGNRWDLLETTA